MARNLITDVAGLRVGHADDARLASGVTAIVFEAPAVAAIDARGGGPATHETDLLDPAMTVDHIDALALSGGSALGLEAASGIQAWLREQGRGFAVRSALVPIVPGASVFDLLNGGDKAWGRFPPYRDLGYRAAVAASEDFLLGSAGAGLGATTVNLKGGLGSASAVTSGGHVVGALAVVNVAGSVVVGDGPWFWAAPWERDDEYGGRGFPSALPPGALAVRTKSGVQESTTLAVVATDAALTKAQLKRVAVMAQTALGRTIHPAHTPLDGDVVFAVATGRKLAPEPLLGLTELGTTAAAALARAIARGVYEATPLPFSDTLPSWQDKFGASLR